MTKTSRYKGLALGSFWAPEIDMIFGDGVGASLVYNRWLEEEHLSGLWENGVEYVQVVSLFCFSLQ